MAGRKQAMLADVILTKPPTDPDSVILVFAIGDPHSIMFCYVGEDQKAWTYRICHEELKRLVIRDDHDEDEFDYFVTPVFCNDRIYVHTSSRGRMAEIEIVKPRRVEVFKLDFSTLVWHVVERCPNLSFYLSRALLQDQALACPIASPDSDKAGNRVYFTFDDSTSPCEPPPTWILISDARALAEAEQDYRDALSNNETGGTEQETRLSFIKERRKFFLNNKGNEGQVTAPASRLEVVYYIEPGKMSNWVVRGVTQVNDDETINRAEQSNVYPICVDGCFYLQDKKGSLGVFSWWEEHGHYTLTRYDSEFPIESSSLEQTF
ncbi:OLC1v1019817C1 [Oldenlandia corymbosa var. corymbosa]|uniref:OLC1v1019817C1 n=1 Tax=Oldenlandia corymbosa var. corymbosa TaxID=529605 RepID=A0AAV1EF45_OLDCO|nr:OLC1v1019817C1 [Oldenlandia corymbosa var. corymbosa]